VRVIIKAEVSGSCRGSAVKLHKACEKFHAKVRSYDPVTGTYSVAVEIQWSGDETLACQKLITFLKLLDSVSDACLTTPRVIIPLRGRSDEGLTARGCPQHVRKALKNLGGVACMDFGSEYRCLRASGNQRTVIAICRRRAVTIISAFGNLQNFAEAPIPCSADELLRNTLDELLRFTNDLRNTIMRG